MPTVTPLQHAAPFPSSGSGAVGERERPMTGAGSLCAWAPLSLCFATRSVPMHGRTPWESDLGGSESALVFAARALAARGHHVDVFTHCDSPGEYDGVSYHDIAALDCAQRVQHWDVFVSLRFSDILQRPILADLRLLWCQDVLQSHPVQGWLAWCDGLVFVSDWHQRDTISRHPAIEPACQVVPNPVELSLLPLERAVPCSPHDEPPLLVHLSRPERGLQPLLDAWPSIRARVPNARLAVARYRSFHEPAGSHIESYCLRMDHRVGMTPGAVRAGNLSKPTLYELLSQAALMVYPAVFDETSCIAAIEAQACGTPVVAVHRGALPETLSPAASLLVEPGPDLVQRFADRVVELLWDPERRRAMGEAGRQRAHQFRAEAIAERWEQVFQHFFERRTERFGPAMRRSLLLRGDTEAASLLPVPSEESSADPPPLAQPAKARWPGMGEPLWRAVLARLGQPRRLALVGGDERTGEVAQRTGAILHLCRLGDNVVDCDAALDLGALLAAPDPVAHLSWLDGLLPTGQPVACLLPAARGHDIPGQRVFPTYDDILQWFGVSAQVGLTLEGEAEWGWPARCWLLSWPAGSLKPRAQRPLRKAHLARPVPTVSACMIVKDAEKTLLTALISLLPIADDIHIFDTGSTDGTLGVIEHFRRHHPVPLYLKRGAFPDDFGAARNTSIEHAQGDWILWIDADEELHGAERLRRLLQSEHCEAFAVRQHNHIFDHGVTHVEIPFRLFRNHRGYRFYGAIHEHPERELNAPICPWLVAERVEILHNGYPNERVRMQKLLHRNLKLLNLDFVKYPGRRLTEILYLRDCVNLARYDLRAGEPIRPDHRAALAHALERFEVVQLPARDRYYNLGRGFYDNGLEMLGLGHELVLRVGNGKGADARHFFRLPEDAIWLASQQAAKYVRTVMGGAKP